MRIDSVYISAFGKFEDKTFNFTDGLNVIYGENEDGKTTLMTFIIMMFYGTNVKSNEELYSNPRKKYLPRNDKAMAGSIDFSLGNRKYRIERIFKATNSGDKISVTDLSTGERETFTGKEDLGKRFIGLSRESAERSIFLSANGMIGENSVAQDELNSRLSNLSDTGSEEISFEGVNGRIEKARNALLTKTGRGGKLSKDKERLDELTLSLGTARATEQARKELEISISNCKSMLNGVKNDISRLTAQIKAAEGGKRYTKLKELVDTYKVIESLNSKLITKDGTQITNTLISDAQSGLNELKVLYTSIEGTKTRFDRLSKELEALKEQMGGITADEIKEENEKNKKALADIEKEIKNLSSKLEALKAQETDILLRKPQIIPVFPIFWGIGITMCALSFISPYYKLPLLIAGGVIALLFLLLTFICKDKPKGSIEDILSEKSSVSEALAEKEKNCTALKENIAELTTKEAVQREREVNAGESFISKNREFTDCADELKRLKNRAEEIERLLNLLSNEKEVSDKGMEIILFSHKSNLSKYESAQMRIAMLKKDLDFISLEEAEKELSLIPEGAISIGDLDELNERLIFKKQEEDILRQKIADDTARAANEFAFIKHPTVIEKEIAELKTLIKKESEYCESLDIASQVMTDAFAKVRESFGSALGKRTAEIFSSITNGKYKNVSVSKSFNLAVEETDVFGSNDWQSLSDGTIDQAYFALRLTVSEFLSKDGEKLPLILDDPFDRYDDARAEKAMEFLSEYAKESQALIFTCHKLFTEKYPFITLK